MQHQCHDAQASRIVRGAEVPRLVCKHTQQPFTANLKTKVTGSPPSLMAKTIPPLPDDSGSPLSKGIIAKSVLGMHGRISQNMCQTGAPTPLDIYRFGIEKIRKVKESRRKVRAVAFPCRAVEGRVRCGPWDGAGIAPCAGVRRECVGLRVRRECRWSGRGMEHRRPVLPARGRRVESCASAAGHGRE